MHTYREVSKARAHAGVIQAAVCTLRCRHMVVSSYMGLVGCYILLQHMSGVEPVVRLRLMYAMFWFLQRRQCR
jgi:hypothetical protein